MLAVGKYAVAVLVVACALSACSGNRTDGSSEGGGSPAGSPTVVASSDVWGSIARSVAGPDARVSSIVAGAADPHSFEPGPAAVAEMSDADLVVYNGGGYDAWVDDILEEHPGVASVEAFALLDPVALDEPEPANVHVFYELNTVKAVAGRIAEALASADPANAGGYRSRAADFDRRADAVLERQHALRRAFPGAAVVATEPVAHYLLLAAGLRDRTPIGFTNAVEQDTDPAPVDIAAMLDLITGRQVAALVFNDQTGTGATRQIREAADQAGVPVLAVTETLPAGTDYLSWQAGLADRLATALRTAR